VWMHPWRVRLPGTAPFAALLVAPTAVLVAALVLAGCASHPAGSGSSTSASHAAGSTTSVSASRSATVPPVRAATTTTHVFSAFGSTGTPAAGVRAHRSGSCFASSITVPDRAAYRCFAGNEILDPCFVESTSPRSAVACYADPWSRAVELTLKAALPTPGPPLKISQPWAIELADGDRCVVTTGTAPILHGLAMRYQCRSGTAGLLASAAALLRAQFRSPGGTVMTVAVAASWTA
jgi:outer membrane murein-binding lipoprotein Lpp